MEALLKFNRFDLKKCDCCWLKCYPHLVLYNQDRVVQVILKNTNKQVCASCVILDFCICQDAVSFYNQLSSLKTRIHKDIQTYSQVFKLGQTLGEVQLDQSLFRLSCLVQITSQTSVVLPEDWWIQNPVCRKFKVLHVIFQIYNLTLNG